ncbi:MAG: phosphoribosylglycinamide formyltransferase, partial [Thermoleophilaceae bacterium]|nr:phosphoribosylglycinamide formyltransferase [Thermoleophilaceae bacterium]
MHSAALTVPTLPLKIAVLASGGGSNLQAVIDQLHGGGLVEIVCVGGDRTDCQAFERAQAAGINTKAFVAADFNDDREARDSAMARWLDDNGIELVVLGGYMQLLSDRFVAHFEGRIINVHPSLLPAFPGLKAVERALQSGASETGVTVHFVDSGVDTGPIISQRVVPIGAQHDLPDLLDAIHAVEHELLPQAIADYALGKVRVSPDDPSVVLL